MPLLDHFANENTEPFPPRSKMLGILCVLTFVGAGLGLLLHASASSDIADYIRSMEEQENTIENLFNDTPVMAIHHYCFYWAIAEAALSLLRLVGAIFMWNQWRIGLFVYCAACIVAFAGEQYLYWQSNQITVSSAYIRFLPTIDLPEASMAFMILYVREWHNMR